MNSNDIYLFNGTSGLEIGKIFSSQSRVLDNFSPVIQVFESNITSGQRYLPYLLTDQNLPIFDLSIASEKDLLIAFQTGKLSHLNFIPYRLLTEIKTTFGFVNSPLLGYLASVLKKENIDQLSVALIRQVSNPKIQIQNNSGTIRINRAGTLIGGSNNGPARVQEESFLEISNNTGVRIEIKDFVIVPSLDKERGAFQRRYAGNVVGYLLEKSALQTGVFFRSSLTKDGINSPTTETLPVELFLISDVGYSSLSPEQLRACTSQAMRYLNHPKLRHSWDAMREDAIEKINKNLPICNRIGCSSIFIPHKEEELYRIYRLSSCIIDKLMAPTGIDAKEVAIELLEKNNLMEDRIHTNISRKLMLRDNKNAGTEIVNRLRKFSFRAKRPLEILEEIDEEYTHIKQTKLKEFINTLGVRENEVIKESINLQKNLFIQLSTEFSVSDAEKITDAINAIMNKAAFEIEKIAAREGQEKLNLQAKCAKIKEEVLSYSQRKWYQQLLHKPRISAFVHCYKTFKVGELQLDVQEPVRKSSATVIRALNKDRESFVKNIKVVETLTRLKKEFGTKAGKLEIDNYDRRGIAIPLYTGAKFPHRYNNSRIEEGILSSSILQSLSPSILDIFNNPTEENSKKLETAIVKLAKNILEKTQSEEPNVSELLLQRDDSEFILKEWINKSKELLPIDAVEGKGENIILIALPGGVSNPLTSKITKITKELQLNGKIQFQDFNRDEMAIIRGEIGHQLHTVKLVSTCCKIYSEAPVEEQVIFHTEPLYVFLPSFFPEYNAEEAITSLLMGIADGIISNTNNKFKYITTENVEISGEKEILEVLKNYRERVWVNSHFIETIKTKRFDYIKERLELLKKEKSLSLWASTCDVLIDKVKRVAKIYHQNI